MLKSWDHMGHTLVQTFSLTKISRDILELEYHSLDHIAHGP